MTKEEMNKYAYELMVKNNSEEAVKQLLLKDKVIKETQQKIDKAIEHIEESLYILKGDGDIPIATSNVRNRYIKPLLKILKGEE